MVARQLAGIFRVVADAFHDEDLCCRELRQVEEGASDLFIYSA